MCVFVWCVCIDLGVSTLGRVSVCGAAHEARTPPWPGSGHISTHSIVTIIDTEEEKEEVGLL